MDRRRFQLAALFLPFTALHINAALAKGTPSSGGAELGSRTSTDPTIEHAVMGMRSLLEVCTRLATEAPPSLGLLFWKERLQSAWGEGDWLHLRVGKTHPGFALPTFAHFEASANEAMARCWPQAGPRLMLLVHSLDQHDLYRVIKNTLSAPLHTRWATLQFERRTGERLYTHLLATVIEVELEWLKTHANRFPNKPAPENAQLEAAHLEVCQRIARAIVESVFLAIALQENQIRQTPLEELNGFNHTTTIVAALGEVPVELPFPVRERPFLASTAPAAESPLTRKSKKKKNSRT